VGGSRLPRQARRKRRKASGTRIDGFAASTRKRSQCRDIDQGAAALVQDLKARGLLDETLVIWGGEFGRTVYSQGKLTATDYGPAESLSIAFQADDPRSRCRENIGHCRANAGSHSRYDGYLAR
jgi:hypothetical protein